VDAKHGALGHGSSAAPTTPSVVAPGPPGANAAGTPRRTSERSSSREARSYATASEPPQSGSAIGAASEYVHSSAWKMARPPVGRDAHGTPSAASRSWSRS